MTFYDQIQQHNWDDVQASIYAKTDADVLRALEKDSLDLNDFQALISPAASKHVEKMALKSMRKTQKRFGNTMQLYIPLYVSNACTNCCVYCGFNHNNKIDRKILDMKELNKEAKRLKELGFEHILLVSGEDNTQCGVNYLNDCLKEVQEHFAQVSIEVQPLEINEYETLKDSGLHAVYIYQETYHEKNYKNYHPKGRKSNYKYRLKTPERLGDAGIHKIGLGVLLGLEDWRTDSFYTAMHLNYLEKRYWQTKYSLSFPRLRPHEGIFEPNSIIDHKELVQLICAYRLFNEQLELSLSTRESPFFRDHMMKLGVTTMSAGSKTNPGGYNNPDDALEQFAVNDDRSPDQVATMIKQNGYEVVWKDWDSFI